MSFQDFVNRPPKSGVVDVEKQFPRLFTETNF